MISYISASLLFILTIVFIIIMSSQQVTKPKPTTASAPVGLKRLYLTLYNGVSCGLWGVILFRVVSVLVENYTKQPFLGLVKRKENAWYETGEFVKWVQTGALLEVVHSLLGMLRNHCSQSPNIFLYMQSNICVSRHRPRPSSDHLSPSRFAHCTRLGRLRAFP